VPRARHRERDRQRHDLRKKREHGPCAAENAVVKSILGNFITLSSGLSSFHSAGEDVVRPGGGRPPFETVEHTHPHRREHYLGATKGVQQIDNG
jgi:hypothetical protein